jgi:RsiW-degrading membrane proteinase PrsW (M82 family)
MKNLLFLFGLVGLVVLLSGCVSTPKTSSGKPEVVIATQDVSGVKNLLVGAMVQRGFAVRDDSAYRISFTKALEGMNAVMTQMAIGNSYSTTPEIEVAYTITATANGVYVVGSATASTQMAFGQIQKMDRTQGKGFLQIQQILDQVKAQAEGR